MTEDKESVIKNRQAEFDEYCKFAERYIRRKGVSPSDVEDIMQETKMRILQKLADIPPERFNAGYFILTARNVWHELIRQSNRFLLLTDSEDDETNQPIDAEKQLTIYEDESERAVLADCMLECFEERSLDEQVLLWRYSFDEKFRLDEKEPESYIRFFGTILSPLRRIRDKFFPLQDEYLPLTEDKRVAISRLRKKLRECLENCIARKKGFA